MNFYIVLVDVPSIRILFYVIEGIKGSFLDVFRIIENINGVFFLLVLAPLLAY
jgi:hypothetical protein